MEKRQAEHDVDEPPAKRARIDCVNGMEFSEDAVPLRIVDMRTYYKEHKCVDIRECSILTAQLADVIALTEEEEEGFLTTKEVSDATVYGKKVRFHLYRKVVNAIYGKVKRGKRVQHPACVTGDIHDFAPDPNRDYTGFKAV